MNFKISIVLAFVVFFGIQGVKLGAQNKYEFANTDMVITGDSLRIRDQPKLKAPILDILYKGNVVRFLEKKKGDAWKGNRWWYKIQVGNQDGYIHSNFALTKNDAKKYLKKFKATYHDKRLNKWAGSPKKAKHIKQYQNLYKNARTDADLARVFRLGRNIAPELAPLLAKELAKNTNPDIFLNIRWLFVYLQGMDYFLVAEGTTVILEPVFPVFLKRAKKTRGKTDDLFFEMMVDAYGHFKHWGNWFHQTWDYGGRSNLGSGIHLRLLKKTDVVFSKGDVFKTATSQLRIEIIHDIKKALAYSKSRDVIVKELKQILKEVKLSKKENNTIKKRLMDFQSKRSSIQTECDKKACDEGG